MEVKLAQERLDGVILVRWQMLIIEPAAAFDAEQVRERTALHQIAVKDRLHLVLQPGALFDQLRASGDLSTQRLCLLIGDPHRRQVVRGQQLGEDRSVDLVGLDLRLRDRACLHRVRHDHTRDARLDHADDRVRVARRLNRNLILRPKALGENPQHLTADLDLSGVPDRPVLPDRDLRELAMHIQTDTSPSHLPPPISVDHDGSQAGERHLRIRARSATGQVAGAANY